MIKRAKVALVGVGNNVSALVQGMALCQSTGSLVGVRRPELGGMGVDDIDVVTAFAMSPGKVGKDLSEAACCSNLRPSSSSSPGELPYGCPPP